MPSPFMPIFESANEVKLNEIVPASLSIHTCPSDCELDTDHIHWVWDWTINNEGKRHELYWMGEMTGVVQDFNGLSLRGISDAVRLELKILIKDFWNELASRAQDELEVMRHEKVWNIAKPNWAE